MTVTRRQFLRTSSLAAAYLTLPAWLSACMRSNSTKIGEQIAAPEHWDTAPTGVHSDIVHLLNRITYGPRPGDVERVAKQGWDAFLDQQLHPDKIDDSALDKQLESFETLKMSNAELVQAYPLGVPPGPREIISQLEAASLLRAIFSERQLFEIMVDFWSNHLNIYIGKNQARWFKTSDDRDVIRQHALGKFRELLLASAKSPAMLVYLDNAENVVPNAFMIRQGGGINENYAREVMELHTVGVDGGYTQADIQPLARALTGWTFTRLLSVSGTFGEFQFVPRLHDTSEKHIPFLNLTLPAGAGVKEGETVLAMLATHPKTAERIASKLCITFVSDDPPAALVARAAKAFLDNDTDIRATLDVILRSDEFKAAAGQKIKLPLRVLTSAVRAIGASVTNHLPLVQQLRVMGQPFFAWQSPNGYPQIGAAWVNTGGMLARWNLAFALAEGRIGGTTVNLQQLLPANASSAEVSVDNMSQALLNAPLPAAIRDTLVQYVNDGPRARKPPELAGLIMASPAFQIH